MPATKTVPKRARQKRSGTTRTVAGAASTPPSTPPDTRPQRRRIRPETRAQLLERLTNPLISLHETSVILRVCPATVRNYCDANYLPHERTVGRQRRFRLKDVLEFHRQREAERKKK